MFKIIAKRSEECEPKQKWLLLIKWNKYWLLKVEEKNTELNWKEKGKEIELLMDTNNMMNLQYNSKYAMIKNKTEEKTK